MQMKYSNRNRFTLYVAAFVLAGCGGNNNFLAHTEAGNVPSSQKGGRIAQPLSSSFRVLHTFEGSGHGDGSVPTANLIDKSGVLYGTTRRGGTKVLPRCRAMFAPGSGCGTVFALTPSGSTYTETVLYSFCVRYYQCPDGRVPLGALIRDKNGNLYGTTSEGGAYDTGTHVSNDSGTVFELTPSGSGYTELVLHSFGARGDGVTPLAGLTFGANGALYGTTSAGGATGSGTVFELAPSGSGYSEHILHSFSLSGDGANPNAGVILSRNGVLYGTTVNGGGLGSCSTGIQHGCGTVYSIETSGQERILYRFKGQSDGAGPEGGVILGKNGTLYGTTSGGGAYGLGTVFLLARSRSGYTERVLYSFGATSNDGADPYSGVILAASGSLYGTTLLGGNTSCGHPVIFRCSTVFELVPSGSGYTEKVLYDFDGGSDGAWPYSDVIFCRNGAVCGAASAYGSFGGGTVFSLTP